MIFIELEIFHGRIFFYVTKGFRVDINNYNAFDVFFPSFPWRPFNSKVQVQGTDSKLGDPRVTPTWS